MIAQVALSLVLLVGALLFVRSLQKLLDVQPGFRPEGIVAVNIDHQPGEAIPRSGVSRSIATCWGDCGRRRASCPRRRSA